MNFGSLPIWAKGLLGVIALLVIAGVIFLATILSAKILLVLGGGVVAVLVMLGLYTLVLKAMDKRRAGRLSLALGTHNKSTGGVGGAAQRAKLDDLRRSFEDGVQKFKNAGKDIYSLPWYVVVGEPGSGKTEAIRHSNVGFPPGLQDELQGTGGTINMNWWFTNQAVFLDTAGRLIFEDVSPGSTSEWQEFLKLLKRVRPNCPINGMLLCIPSDTLIKDNQEDLDAKARKLAGQLTDIQRALDIRFPVFILVTKSDLVPGFREFFENIHDPRLQHQMVGWSNPRSLDEPFKADELEDLLDAYMSALYRKRLGLIEDPNPLQIGGKRMDEVDILFSYPSQLKSIFPRLRRYLETIFAAGEWSQKPLFLRGIYFTSSLQEGSALDEELAQALDLGMDELPEGRLWEKEKAYFLRDLCMEKVFKESRLITRATNARKQLRQRQMVVLWSGIAALVGIAAFAYYAAQSLKESIGSQVVYWQYLEDPTLVSGDGVVPPVVYEGREAGTYFNNTQGAIDLEDMTLTLESFHERLYNLAKEEIRVPAVFKLLFLNAASQEERLKAQRVAFEYYILKPLVDLSHEKFIEMEPEDWNDQATDALATILAMEKENADRIAGIPPDPLADVNVLEPLMQFLTGESIGANLPQLLGDIYFSSGLKDEEAVWPPQWASGGRTLRENEAIAGGIQKYLAFHRAKSEAELGGLRLIASSIAAFEDAKRYEDALLEEMNAFEDENDFEAVREGYDRYRRGIRNLEREVEALAERYQMDEDRGFSLFGSYEASLESAVNGMSQAVQNLEQRLGNSARDLSSRAEGASGMEAYPLFSQLAQVIDRESQAFVDQISNVMSIDEVQVLKDYDQEFLEIPGLGDPYAFQIRAELYETVLSDYPDSFDDFQIRVGELDDALRPALRRYDRLKDDVKDYRGIGEDSFRDGMENLLDFYFTQGMRGAARVYEEAVKTAVGDQIGFPLVSEEDDGILTAEDMVALRDTLDAVDRDLGSDGYFALPRSDQNTLSSLAKSYDPLMGMVNVLITQRGNPRICTFTLTSQPKQQELLALFYPDREFNSVYAGLVYRDISVNDNERTRSFLELDEEIGRAELTNERVAFNFFQVAESEQPEEVIEREGAWAPLQLLLKTRSIRAEKKVGEVFEEGEVWHVLMELPAVGGESKAMVLTLNFSQPLPPRETWPSIDDFEIN